MEPTKLVIVGGVAGGASAAARARRLDETAHIVLVERGMHPSFANCGIPYFIGGVIAERDDLLVTPVERLRGRYGLDVRIQSEAIGVDADAQVVTIRDLVSGEEYEESYDRLILSTGAAPIRPPIPGVDSERVQVVRDLADADRIRGMVEGGMKSAVVVGAGFVGIEMAENLAHRGLDVTIVELADQVLPPWDREMMMPIEAHLREKGVTLRLSESAGAFETTETGSVVVATSGGDRLETDLVVLSVGVRPENKLAIDAGLDLGERGGIQVDDHMRTSHPNIYAVGDVVEVTDYVTGTPSQVPLAGPANRQGRIAADHIFGRPSRFRGTQGTAIVGVFDMAAAMTGASEKGLQRLGLDYEKVYLHPGHHASYYSGAETIHMKLLFAPEDGRILGAQAVGRAGVDKRIDVIAMAIQAGLTVFDLEEAELCYTPQFGSAKDAINMAGFVAANQIRGDHPIVHADRVREMMARGATLLDVRSPAEFDRGHIAGAINCSIDQLRACAVEPDKRAPVIVYCAVGQRGYLATRLLRQLGFEAYNLSGGFSSWSMQPTADVT
ncbi:MAG: FAD-dependent oxidoreductase [Actinomycetia bacterium]|nr:FAD-dependent oxidoreductase [Actinomycetes bacterium]